MHVKHLLALALPLAITAGVAGAVAPPTDVPSAVVPMPGQNDRVMDPALQARMSADSQALADFRARYGEWRVALWDELTGTPDRAFGEPIRLADGVADADAAVDLAFDFVAANEAFFGVDAEDLTLISAHFARDVYYVLLQQTFGGLDVLDSRVLLRIGTNGDLILIGSDVHPDVAANPFAQLGEAQAIAVAQSGLSFDPVRDLAEHEGRVIVPIRGEDRIDYVTTHAVRLEVDGDAWLAYVNAQSGSILSREPTAKHIDIVGEVTGDVVEEDPFGPTFSGAMWNQNVFMSPSGASGFTAEDGSFDIPYIGADVQTSSVRFVTGNQQFNVNNNLGGDGIISQPVTPGAFTTLDWNNANSVLEERVPFYHLQRQREQLEVFDPSFPFLVGFVTVQTNVSGSCNAQWTGSQIRLFREGSGCIPSGQIPSVAAHEYGHGLADWQFAGSVPCALIEALPDIKAMYYTRQPQIGTGLFGQGQVLRDGHNTLTWAQALSSCPTGGYSSGECHCKADVTMGAAWKTRVNMIEKYGDATGATTAEEAIHFAIYGSGSTPQAYLLDVLAENDDDGNLANGTPDWTQICDAFGVHGLPCPALTEYITITHLPLGDTVNTTDPYEVVATIVPTNETLDPASTLMSYRVSGGSWQVVPMSPTGNPDEYSAVIPAQGGGDYVEYYITAAGTGGAQAESPDDAPFLDVHRFAIGIFQASFVDEAEFDNGWTLGDANDDATGGFWVRDDPNGTTLSGQLVNPEDDATVDPGTDCYFTGQGPVGGSVVLEDIDGGCTTLISPVLDLSSTGYARVSFKRWWYSNGGADAMTASISTDGGSTWTDVDAVSGIENAWNEVTVDVPSSEFDMTATTLLRFVACDVGTNSITEAGVDDVSVALLTDDVTDVADAAPLGRFRVEQNRPNPFNPVTTIRYEVAASEHVSLRVYNVSGQLVRTLVDGVVDAGVYDVRWDGTSDSGAKIASGTYFYRVVAGGS